MDFPMDTNLDTTLPFKLHLLKQIPLQVLSPWGNLCPPHTFPSNNLTSLALTSMKSLFRYLADYLNTP